MTLTHILVFAAAAVPYLLLMPERGRKWALFVGSVIAIYWLQPKTTIRTLDFIFPSATLALVGLTWLISRDKEQGWRREDTISAAIMVGVMILLTLERFFVESIWLTPSRPPSPLMVGMGVGIVIGVLALINQLPRLKVERSRLLVPGMLLIVVLFVILKTEPLAEEVSRRFRDQMGQSTAFASATELQWLGFSYVAFRLIHTLRDRQTKKLPALTLREYTTYAIFFPAYTAGPIDRADRFLTDLKTLPGPEPSRLVQAGMRIAVGIGKKFVIADSLAYFALNATKSEQAHSTGALWVMLYAFAFQIYFDFSGYTDIAIGIGQLFGIKLPENFNQPYLKRNITVFWQSWHMTLSQWVRDYVFLPLSRYLLKRKHKPGPVILALIGQMTTMLIIGLWHGVVWHFVVWGLWHGTGLFIHKVWSDRTRFYYIRLRDHPRLGQGVQIVGVILTFHFVVLGWIWFALPDMNVAWDVFLRVFGIA
jgi:D-alanyl-lipoteichoic acid acyltransferase DltB (MBOAT superfamily)